MSGLGFSPIIRLARDAEVREAGALLHRSATLAFRDINWHHALDETIEWFCASYEAGVWMHLYVADVGGQVAGIMCLKPQFIDQLFVDPKWQRKGLGEKLLDKAKEVFPERFDLFVFQKNLIAIRFYEKNGLARGKAGRSPAEDEPDFLYHWRVAR